MGRWDPGPSVERRRRGVNAQIDLFSREGRDSDLKVSKNVGLRPALADAFTQTRTFWKVIKTTTDNNNSGFQTRGKLGRNWGQNGIGQSGSLPPNTLQGWVGPAQWSLRVAGFGRWKSIWMKVEFQKRILFFVFSHNT